MDHNRLAQINRRNARATKSREWTERYNNLAAYHEKLHAEQQKDKPALKVIK